MSQTFNKAITVQRSTKTEDGQGVTVDDWTAPTIVSSGIQASIQEMSANETFAWRQRGVTADVEIYTRTNTNARQNDRVPFPDGGGYYRVVRNRDEAGRGRIFVLTCQTVGG